MGSKRPTKRELAYMKNYKRACQTPVSWQRSSAFLYTAVLVVVPVVFLWGIVKSVKEIKSR